MYPFIRLAWQMLATRRAPRLRPLQEHVSHHICMPWDLDGFLELNNGRTLTLYDLGRFGAGARMGLTDVLRRENWGLAVAGCSVRYRKRVTVFQRIEMRTQCVTWDERFIYIVQSMWIGGTCTSQALLRTAVTSRRGTVPADRMMQALDWHEAAPQPPAWIAAWIAAEGTRPWPPSTEAEDRVSEAA